MKIRLIVMGGLAGAFLSSCWVFAENALPILGPVPLVAIAIGMGSVGGMIALYGSIRALPRGDSTGSINP